MRATVWSSMWAATQSRSTVVVTGSTGAPRSSMPKRWQALSNAGCAVSGLMTLGRVDAAGGAVLAVGEHGVADAAGAAGGDDPGGLGAGDRLGVEEVERHGDDLALEVRGARAHVALQRVDVREQPEGLGQEVVVVVVAAVHGPGALPGLPEGVLLLRHGGQLGEDVVAGAAVLGQRAVHREAVLVRVVAHRAFSLAARRLVWAKRRQVVGTRSMSSPTASAATTMARSK